MAYVLKRMHGLMTLTMTLLPPERGFSDATSGSESSTQVKFEFQEHGASDGSDVGIGDEFQCPARDLGIPDHLTWNKVVRRGDYRFDLPPAFKDWLSGALQLVEPGERALWIHLVKPYGYLGLFPWERLLAPLVARAILRLPDFLVDPPKQTSSVVDIALCCLSGGSGPQGRAALVVRAAKAMTIDGLRRSRLALFVDPQVNACLTQMPQGLPSGCSIYVYEGAVDAVPDTSLFTEYVVTPFNDYLATPVRSLATNVQDWLRRKRQQDSDLDSLSGATMISRAIDPVKSPFLRWVRKTIGSRSVDLVHVIADSTLYLERGALLLDRAGTGKDASDGHLVSAAEMLSFQAQVGAWAVGLSSAPDNFSDIGLRQFADTLAQLRPGPLLYHDADAAADSSCTDLRAAYAFLLSMRPADPPQAGAIFMYCEPFRVSDQRQPEATLESLSWDNAVAGATLPGQDTLRDAFLQADNVPSWVAASERFVDLYKQRLAELSRSAGKDTAELKEIRSALGRMQDLVAKTADFSGKGDL